MPDESIKQKARRAKKAAIEKCEEMGYKIITSDNSLFCFVATRETDMRMVRVSIMDIGDKDIQKLREIDSPAQCVAEIWHRRDDGRFEIRKVAR